MTMLIQDVKYALRAMVRNLISSSVIVLTLAIGIGANSAIFTIINAVFLRPIPIQDPAQLVRMFTIDAKNRGDRDLRPISYQNFEDYRDKNRVFSGMYAAATLPVNFTRSGQAEQIRAEIVSGNYFELLGVKAVIGRTFSGEEDRVPGGDPVIVVSDGFWKRSFGGDQNVPGKELILNGHKYSIIGVAPPGFRGTNILSGPDLWVPMMMHQQLFTTIPEMMFGMRRALQFDIVARLKGGVSLPQAESELKALASSLENAYPIPNGGRSITLLPLLEATINPDQRGSHVRVSIFLMAVVAMVLLIACANIANLLLVRVAGRWREVAVRQALGASRGRLARQFLTESLLLAGIGGALGSFLAVGGRQILWSLRPQELLHSDLDLGFDWRVVLVTVLITIGAGLLFGSGPALYLSRREQTSALWQRGGQIFVGRGGFRFQELLIVGQVTLSFITLVAAGLFLFSLRGAQKIDPGFDPNNLLVFSFDLDAQRYSEPQAQQFYAMLQERVGSLPGVLATTVSSSSPLVNQGFMRTIFPVGDDGKGATNGVFAPLANVSPSFFRTLKIPLVRGREFNDGDRANTLQVAIVNERAARVFWPNQDAIGKRFKFFGDDAYIEVIGVAKDCKYLSLGEEPIPYVYAPIAQQYFAGAMTLHVRMANEVTGATNTMISSIRGLDNHLPIFDVSSVEQAISRALWAPRMGAALFTVFGVVALLLACLGLYGVIAHSTKQRTNEIGIRMALGATPVDVLRLIAGRGMAIVGVGIVLGLIAVLAMSRMVSNLFYGTGATNPTIYGLACLLLSSVALVACFFPAFIASRINPTVALRND